MHKNVEHVAEDASGDGHPPVKLLVEFDHHGLTIWRQGSDENYSSSYLCLDLSEGVVSVYASDSESEEQNVVVEWKQSGFEKPIPIHDPPAGHRGRPY